MRALELLLERNIVNVKDIDPFVARVVQRVRTPRVSQWLRSKLPAFLRRNYDGVVAVSAAELPHHFPGEVPDWARRGVEQGDLEKIILDDALGQRIGEVVDYLESNDGQQVNLARFPMDQALVAAREWHEALAKQRTYVGADAGGEVELRRYGNGYRWVQLTSEAALGYEGRHMGHCVGGGSYDAGVKQGQTQIYSLRDQQNRPHITIEVDVGSLMQVKGKQNLPPVAKYHRALLDFLNSGIFNDVDVLTKDLIKVGIFVKAGRFGTISQVSMTSFKLGSGHIVHVLPEQHHTLYICNERDAILAEIDVLPKMINKIKLVASAKEVRPDIIELARRYAAFSTEARTTLQNSFGLIDADVGGVVSMFDEADVIAEQNGYRLAKSPIPYDKTVYVIDRDDHPHLMLVIGMGGKISHVNTADSNWTACMPVVLKGMHAAGITGMGALTPSLKRAGYVGSGDDWYPGNEVVGAAEKIHDGINGAWYLVGESIVLIMNGQGRAALLLQSSDEPTDEEPLEAFDVDEDYSSLSEDATEECIHLINSNVVDMQSAMVDGGRLLEYNIFVDSSGIAHKVDWHIALRQEEVFYNEHGEVTKQETKATSLDDFMAAQDVNYEECQTDILPKLFSNQAYQIENQPPAYQSTYELYDEPAGYREHHGLDEGEPLPEVVRWVTRVTLRQ